jgi:hypothetical protein
MAVGSADLDQGTAARRSNDRQYDGRGVCWICQVWVIDANSLVTRVHRHLGAEGYRTVFEAGSEEEIVAMQAPSVAMCIARLGLKSL